MSKNGCCGCKKTDAAIVKKTDAAIVITDVAIVITDAAIVKTDAAVVDSPQKSVNHAGLRLWITPNNINI